MMRIPPILTPNVQRHPGRLRKTLQTMLHHLARQLSHLLPADDPHLCTVPLPQVNDAVRSVGDVDDGPGERLVEGRVAATKADERSAVPEGFIHGRTEGEEDVFGGVVLVDVKIARGADRKGPAGMLGEGVEHVVEKADAGVEEDCLRARYLGCVSPFGEGN